MSNKKPNILFLFPDQYHADFFEGAPGLPIRTPNLNRLRKSGMAFSNAFTPSPLCAPARACLASGRAYGDCGVLNNSANYPLDQPTYYHRLRDQGYTVCGVGKFDLHKNTRDKANLDWGLDGSRCLKEWGFTEGIDNEGKMDGSGSYLHHRGEPKGPYLAYLKKRGMADEYIKEHKKLSDNFHTYVTCLDDDAYCDNWVAKNGLNFLHDFPREKPWHLVVNFTGPHDPMDVTESMLAGWSGQELSRPRDNDQDAEKVAERRRNYAVMVENIDRLIGEFLRVVEERGELDNTLIVFSSDHGEMLGEHSKWGKGVWNHASIRVPLVVAGPGIEKGKSSDALVILQDLCATFMDYSDATELPNMYGKSLRPVLEGGEEPHRDFIYSALFRETENDWECVFDGDYKLVRNIRTGETSLYNLKTDPYEDNAIIDDETTKRMTRLFESS